MLSVPPARRGGIFIKASSWAWNDEFTQVMLKTITTALQNCYFYVNFEQFEKN